MGFSVNFPVNSKANQIVYINPDSNITTVEEALNDLYINGVSNSGGNQNIDYTPVNYSVVDTTSLLNHLEGIDNSLNFSLDASNVSYDNTNTDLNSSNIQNVITELSSSIDSSSKSFYRTNRENISVNKQLQISDPNLQILKNESGGTVTVNLPTSPIKDSYFLIASREDSIGPINVNTIVLYPGDRLELIYDGVEWFSL